MGNIAQPLPAKLAYGCGIPLAGTQSIPPFSKPCLRTKSLAASSCRFNQSFPNDSIWAFPIEPPIASRNILACFRRCGRGVLRGAAFRQRPLSPLTSQCSCRDKNIASGGTSAERFCESWNIRVDPQFSHWRDPLRGFPPVAIPEIFRERRTNALVREHPRLPCVKGAGKNL